ncbi:MAG TPA: hypothetical protein VM513_27690 [Kofleriaceae bacterium]|jgi:hypothetical protein|nr:hypothetical protein [Kofleriaceae bacterium]
MQTRMMVVGALLLVACGEAEPVEWSGAYEGSVLIESFDCETGEALEPEAFSGVVTIAELGNRVTVNRECPVVMEKSGDATARVTETACNSTFSDGTPVREEVLGGSASIDGDELSLNFSRRITYSGVCDSVRDTFVGTRR